MATINAVGVGTRHALARALATANLAPADATFRVLSATVTLNERRRVVRSDVTIDVREARPLSLQAPQSHEGVVNPDGLHPLMVLMPPCPEVGVERAYFLDILPVSWDRWTRCGGPGTRPAGIDPLCPRTGVDFEQAEQFAGSVDKRLPTPPELRAAWGPERFPWGPSADPRLGRVGAPRYDALPELGQYPPTAQGLFDLGAWLWQWTSGASVLGGFVEGAPAGAFPARADPWSLTPTAQLPWPKRTPVGLRLAAEG